MITAGEISAVFLHHCNGINYFLLVYHLAPCNYLHKHIDNLRRFLYIILLARYLQSVILCLYVYEQLLFNQLYIFVKAAEQTYCLFHSVNIYYLFKQSVLTLFF